MRFFLLIVAAATAASSATVVGYPQAGPATRPLTPVAVTKVVGAYVTVNVGLSDTSVAPGGKITLVVDVTPHTAIHLYAPGQDGYLPVVITLEKSARYQAAPLVYPPSHPVFFPVLAQTIKLYDASFRLTQLLTMHADTRGAVHVAGTLDYQACDDKVCYKPEKVALSWTVVVSSR